MTDSMAVAITLGWRIQMLSSGSPAYVALRINSYFLWSKHNNDDKNNTYPHLNMAHSNIQNISFSQLWQL